MISYQALKSVSAIAELLPEALPSGRLKLTVGITAVVPPLSITKRR
jgi:hypothetical protein